MSEFKERLEQNHKELFSAVVLKTLQDSLSEWETLEEMVRDLTSQDVKPYLGQIKVSELLGNGTGSRARGTRRPSTKEQDLKKVLAAIKRIISGNASGMTEKAVKDELKKQDFDARVVGEKRLKDWAEEGEFDYKGGKLIPVG